MATSRIRVSTSGRAVDRAERFWQIFALLSMSGLLCWYFAGHYRSADRLFAFTSGIIGVASAVLAATLSIRKRLAYQGVGRMSNWLTGHIYFGLISAMAIFLHSGMRAGGPSTEVLLGVFCFAVATGVVGLLIARRLPPLLTAIEENPAMIEDLIESRSECLRGLHELAAGGSAEFRSLVKRRLVTEVGSIGRMVRFYTKRTTLAQELPAFQREYETVLRKLKTSEQAAFRRAAEYALRANKMNAEYLLHRLLRGWLTFHMMATVTTFALAVVHVFTVLFY